MIRTFLFRLSLLLLMSAAAACTNESRVEHEPACRESGLVFITASVDHPMQRSSYGFDESQVRELLVLAYMDGALAATAREQGSSMNLRLQDAGLYHIYALANVGDVVPPVREEDLAGFRLDLDGLGAAGINGSIPMATSSFTALNIGSYPISLSLVLERLYAKCSLVIDRQLKNCGFSVTGVALKNVASDLTPFSGRGKTVSVSDGDFGSPEDVAALNSGHEAVFYLPENARGILLPDNADPSAKIPDNLGAEASLCTYLEVKGTWSTAGAVGEITYRMYPGTDNVRDFSILRNTVSQIRLVLTDSGSLALSWKVSVDGLQDTRSLCFETDELTVWQGGAFSTCRILADAGAVNPGEISYTVSGDADELEESGISFSLSGGVLSVSTSYVGTGSPSARLLLSSWDGRKTDVLTVRVSYVPGNYTAYTLTRPQYTGQWGCFTFPDATAQTPVTFTLPSGSFTVPGSGSGCGYLFDTSSQTAFYHPAGGKKVFFRAIGTDESLSCAVHLSRFTAEADVVLAGTAAPSYTCPDMELCEDGRDVRFGISLSGKDGGILDLSSFAVPDAVLSATGRNLTDRERFSEFADMYVGSLIPMWKENGGTSFEEIENDPGWSFIYEKDVNSTPSIASQEGVVADLCVWGLEADADKPRSGTLRLYNDYFDADVMYTDVPLTVVPAFPDQRYLGTVMNGCIAPGNLRSYSSPVDFRAGGHDVPVAGAAWTVRDAYFDAGDRPCDEMATVSQRCYLSSFDGSAMRFQAPTVASFPACGAFLLSGSVVNPHSGRTIRGYYTLDVCLDLTVGVQVDADGTQLLYSFVPFCEYSTPAYSDIWNDNFPSIAIRHSPVAGGGRPWELTWIHVPENDTDNSCSFDTSNSLVFTDVDGACNLIYSLGLSFLFSDFGFASGSGWKNGLMLDREGFSKSPDYTGVAYERGQSGYYRLRRQTDVRNITETGSHCGLDNLLVEPHLGSFTLY